MRKLMLLLALGAVITSMTGCGKPYQEQVSTEYLDAKNESHKNVISLSAAAVEKGSEYTVTDLRNLQDFLLVRETPDLSGKDYDLNNDDRWDVFDLCLMRRELLRNNEVGGNNMNIPQTGYTEAVPAEYMSEADKKGSIVRLDYESEDYVRDGAAITKTAYVYTPYGYDESDTETRYNIIYLMHGWGGRAGEYFNFTTTKNVFDHMIENGDIPPMIIVSATFYNENSSTDFSSSISEFRQFYLDFKDHLMPTVEGKFHTYAQSTSEEDLKASRDHRAFGGFSLGSVTTWLQFCHNYDYIRYFLPMSGSCWYYGTYGDFQTENNVDFIEQLVKNEKLDERGYFIYATTGTRDNVKSQTVMQMEEMLKRDIFTPDHIVFYQKDGGYHDFNAVQEYLFNALPLFFRNAE